MRILALAISLLLISSCKRKTDISQLQYQDEKQLLTLNAIEKTGEKFVCPSLVRLSKDSILIGDKLLAKIFFKKKELRIVNAFVDCHPLKIAAVDTATYKVKGCSNGLLVQGDTIFIGFRPTKLGLNKFPEITILTRDRAKIFRTVKYSFQYKVVENLKTTPMR
jgi:hypothetical protein